MKIAKLQNWSSKRLLATGFALMILLGAALLMLPVSNRGGVWLPFTDALFTATSATCVTGLVLFDTWTQFTLFGQLIILFLIQVGGLGFITLSVLFSLAVHRKIGLRERSLLADGVGSLQLTGVVRMARRILAGTAVFEGAGTLLLAIRFVPQFGLARGIWMSLFHAVSAFCNAGFDLLGRLEPSSSLTSYSKDPLVILTIASLIIVGGIGFMVWTNIADCKFDRHKLSYHTKVVLLSTAVLITAGALLFFITEKDASMRGMGIGERLLSSFFQSVTPRTAGFNCVDVASLSSGGKALTVLLMFIGAAPGGTGGGVKITTFITVLAAAVTSQRVCTDTVIGRHRIDNETTMRAFRSVISYIGMTFVGVFILCTQDVEFTDSVFECFSAIGTVGLSTGVTPSLTTGAKLVITLLMYIGRLGSFTVFLAISPKDARSGLKNPLGKLLVG